MSEYTPTTDEVAEVWAMSEPNPEGYTRMGLPVPDETEQRAEFNRWLDQVRAVARREGWEACALAIQDGLGAWDAFEHYGRSETEEDRHADQ